MCQFQPVLTKQLSNFDTKKLATMTVYEFNKGSNFVKLHVSGTLGLPDILLNRLLYTANYNTTKNLLIQRKICLNFLTKAIVIFSVPIKLISVSESAICWIKSK